jgi:hypothetical protein
MNELAANLAHHIDDQGNLMLPSVAPREQADTAKWFAHWSWKLKPSDNRPRLETETVADLLTRV